MTLDNELKKKAVKLKALSKRNMHAEIENIEYVDLGLYNKDSNLYFWDSLSIAELDISEIKRGLNILEGIISFGRMKLIIEIIAGMKIYQKYLKGIR